MAQSDGFIQGEKRSLRLSMSRGLRQRCPNCGTQHLFRAYLKPIQNCTYCGEDWEAVRADDGPAWATMLIVGHILGPLVVAILLNESIPNWTLWVGMPIVTMGLCLWMLPRVKGLFMALIWTTRAPTS